MATTLLQCAKCGENFQKENKELNRRRRFGKSDFYCSLKCAGSLLIDNIPEEIGKNYRFVSGSMDHTAATAKAKKRNTKYTPEDKVFAEHLRRARGRKHQCDLDIEYLKELWFQQKGICSLTNIPLKHPCDTTDHNYMASLDRKNSSKGYLKGNVQFISCTANWAKSSRNDDEIVKFFSLVIQYNVDNKGYAS